MISITELSMFTDLYRKIEIEALKVLREINEIRPIDGYKFLNLESIELDYITFEGDEYWAYGGHQGYILQIDMDILIDKTARMKYYENLHLLNKEDIDNGIRLGKQLMTKKKVQLEQLKRELGED